MHKTIFAFGEILWDLLPEGAKLGGAPFNFAYRVHELGDKALFVSRLGRDELGEKAHQQVVSLGLSDVLLQWDEKYPTGTVEVSFDDNHNPDYLIIPHVAYDYIELSDKLITTAEESDCICFGTLIQRAEQSKKTLKVILDNAERAIKLCDINLRKKCYSRQTVEESLKMTDILKLNREEVYLLIDLLGMKVENILDFCKKVVEQWSLKYCLVTFGEKGALAFSEHGSKIYDPGYRVLLKDSLGCGDAFSAGFISKILCGKTVEEACQYGNRLGAFVATQSGATQKIDPNDFETFFQRHLERNIDPEMLPYTADYVIA